MADFSTISTHIVKNGVTSKDIATHATKTKGWLNNNDPEMTQPSTLVDPWGVPLSKSLNNPKTGVDEPTIRTNDINTQFEIESLNSKTRDLNTKIDNLTDENGNMKVSQNGSITEVNSAQILASQKELINILSNTENSWGIEWDQKLDTITRIGDAEGLTQADFDDIAPWSLMRRCNLADDGTVNAYYGDPTYVEDGSNGQVMVEIPKFFYRGYRTAKGYAWLISPNKRGGYSVHPAFVRNKIEKEYIYIGAYEATLYDDSAGSYVGDGVAYDYSNDKLASVAGLQPISGNVSHFDIEEARQLAQNRGTGWEQQDFLTVSAIQMLFVIEYASLDWQGSISRGITNLDSGTGNHSQNTGHTSSLGNSSGEVAISTLENGATGASETYACSYRGIENFFGNIWKWVDGINIQDNVPYIADNSFDSDVFVAPYESLGVTLSQENGYISNIAMNSIFDFGFFPTEVAGSSSTYLHDYYYQNSGNRVGRLGGIWINGSGAGGFYWSLHSSSASSYRYLGARLLHIPQN